MDTSTTTAHHHYRHRNLARRPSLATHQHFLSITYPNVGVMAALPSGSQSTASAHRHCRVYLCLRLILSSHVHEELFQIEPLIVRVGDHCTDRNFARTDGSASIPHRCPYTYIKRKKERENLQSPVSFGALTGCFRAHSAFACWIRATLWWYFACSAATFACDDSWRWWYSP